MARPQAHGEPWTGAGPTGTQGTHGVPKGAKEGLIRVISGTRGPRGAKATQGGAKGAKGCHARAGSPRGGGARVKGCRGEPKGCKGTQEGSKERVPWGGNGARGNPRGHAYQVGARGGHAGGPVTPGR